MQNVEIDMGTFNAFVKKEFLHIIRDPRTMVITVLIPIVLLILFGFAISTEVKTIRMVAVVDIHNEKTRITLERFQQNSYFEFIGLVSPLEADKLLRAGETDIILYLRSKNGEINSQIIVDSSNTANAKAMVGYTQGVLNENANHSPFITRTLYNPQLKSAYNFVPGIMGMIFILICAIMTSVSIVREKENGTLNLLLVSPIRPHSIIIGKLIPYFLLSFVILSLMLTIAYTILGLPFSSNVFNIVLISILYILLSLSIGLLVSTIVKTQLTALIVSAVMFMIPVLMLSGMIFPIDNMPEILQGISCIIPARWYIQAMRKLMIQQLDLTYVGLEVTILLFMTLGLILLAIRNFYSDK